MDDSVDRRQGEVARAFAALVGLEPERRREEVEALKRRDPELASQVEERLVAFGMASAGGQEEWNDPLIGARVSHYRIEARVGAGGMGVVYRAKDERLERMVALKFLPGHLARDPSLNRRFLVEAKAASALEHENICVVHELEWTADGRAFLVMPFYEGEPLSTKLERGPLAVDEAVAIACQMASGLAAAHAAGIIHRDVKPSNVMVTPGGKVKVLDFGLAKAVGVALTVSGMTVGTVAYASPEQLRGEEVDERTDVWSLGVVLYEMLTGRRAFERDTPTSTMGAVLHGEVEPIASIRPEVPDAVCRVVEGCLRRDRDERIGRMEEVGEELGRSVGSGGRTSGRKGEWASGRAGDSTRPVIPGAAERRPGISDSGNGRKGEWARGGGGVSRIESLESEASGRKGEWARWRIAASLFLAAALGISWWWWMGRDATPAGEEEPVTMAVLPFRGYGLGEEAWIADAATEEVIAGLREVAGIEVIPFRSTMGYRASTAGLQRIGRELEVDVVLDGSIVRDQGALRVRMDLVRGNAETPPRAGSLRVPVAAWPTLRSETVKWVLAELNTGEGAAARPRAEEEIDPEARRLFLRGEYLYRQFLKLHGIRSLEEMLPTLQRAVAIEPGYASAWGRLAFAWAAQGWICSLPWKVARDSARKAADRALEIDPDNARGLHALAYLYLLEGERERAQSLVDQALRTNPGDVEILRDKATWLSSNLGEYRLAEAILQQALEQDPGSLLLRMAVADNLADKGMFDRAIEEANEILTADSTLVGGHWLIGTALMNSGRPSEAVVAFRRSRGSLLSPENYPQIFIRALKSAGRPEEIADFISELSAGAAAGQMRAVNRLLAVYVELGDYAAAIDVLERSGLLEDDLCSLGSVGVIRSDPAFGPRLEAVLKANAAKR